MRYSITHICPPSTGGVSDYVDVAIQHQPSAMKLPLNKVLAKDFKLSGNVLLHLSGYGYQKRGAPLWLLNKFLTDQSGIKKLGIFFHELYAFGPPWGSAFWLSPVQRHIARRLAEMSDFWITNREDSAQWLRQFSGHKPHAVLPVFSNVGEMPANTQGRAPKIVIFGSAGLRLSTYRGAGETLFSWAREQGLELHDIGPAIDDPVLFATLRRVGVVQHGRLETAEVSKQLSDAMFGVVAYPIDYVAKSGVFAAYCAHGVCPILISKHYALSDALMAGTHYLAGLPQGAIQHSIVSNIESAAWNWYQPHRIMAHVNTLKQLFNEADTAC